MAFISGPKTSSPLKTEGCIFLQLLAVDVKFLADPMVCQESDFQGAGKFFGFFGQSWEKVIQNPSIGTFFFIFASHWVCSKCSIFSTFSKKYYFLKFWKSLVQKMWLAFWPIRWESFFFGMLKVVNERYGWVATERCVFAVYPWALIIICSSLGWLPTDF